MSWFRPSSTLDKVFVWSIAVKGMIGLFEFLGGLLLFLVDQKTMHAFIVFITQKELLEDKNDKIANILFGITQYIHSSGKAFLITYLWIHALIKLVAVIGLLKNQLWAYPFSLISLGALMAYQLYTLIIVQVSVGMIVLTIFDAFILWLIWREYRKIRHEPTA